MYSSPESEVLVSANGRKSDIMVCVNDKGIGIPADELDKVFLRLYRSERRPSTEPGGLGLGLAISKGLVESHDGRIWAKSALGKGSTFCFTIPTIVKTRK